MKTNDRIAALLKKLQMLEFQEIGISQVLAGEKPKSYTDKHERQIRCDLGKTLDDMLGLHKKIRALTSDPVLVGSLDAHENAIKAKLAEIISFLKEDRTPDSTH